MILEKSPQIYFLLVTEISFISFERLPHDSSSFSGMALLFLGELFMIHWDLFTTQSSIQFLQILLILKTWVTLQSPFELRYWHIIYLPLCSSSCAYVSQSSLYLHNHILFSSEGLYFFQSIKWTLSARTCAGNIRNCFPVLNISFELLLSRSLKFYREASVLQLHSSRLQKHY